MTLAPLITKKDNDTDTVLYGACCQCLALEASGAKDGALKSIDRCCLTEKYTAWRLDLYDRWHLQYISFCADDQQYIFTHNKAGAIAGQKGVKI